MDMIYLVLAFSGVLWFLIDRFKPLWSSVDFGKYITLAVSAIGAFGLSFGFKLDLIQGFGLSPEITVLGQVLTALVIMSGSSAAAEIIEKVKSGTIGTGGIEDFLDDTENVEEID